jgi:RNA polymerase sigma factor (sigma-70 family)
VSQTPHTDAGRVTADSERMEALYRAEWAPMVRLAFILCGSRELAEDVVHDAFLRLSARAAVNPPGYLRTIVVNLVRDHHRRHRVEARHLPAPPTPWADPEIDETWVALHALPERQRLALVLRFYADLPVEEVAHLLDCPPGTAKSLIHRGLERLRKELQP